MHLLPRNHEEEMLKERVMEESLMLVALRENLSRDVALLENEERVWDRRKSELMGNIANDKGEVMEASIPEGFYTVDTPRQSYINNGEEFHIYTIAVRKGAKPSLEVNPYYHTVDVVRGVPKNEFVYFWDNNRVAWRFLFQSDSPKGMRWTGTLTGWTPER